MKLHLIEFCKIDDVKNPEKRVITNEMFKQKRIIQNMHTVR